MWIRVFCAVFFLLFHSILNWIVCKFSAIYIWKESHRSQKFHFDCVQRYFMRTGKKQRASTKKACRTLKRKLKFIFMSFKRHFSCAVCRWGTHVTKFKRWVLSSDFAWIWLLLCKHTTRCIQCTVFSVCCCCCYLFGCRHAVRASEKQLHLLFDVRVLFCFDVAEYHFDWSCTCSDLMACLFYCIRSKL